MLEIVLGSCTLARASRRITGSWV